MPELLVSCDKQIESALSGSEQGTVFQVRPAQLKGRLYNMVDQVISERYRSSLIEENVHFGWGPVLRLDFNEALLGVLENRNDLVQSYSGKPLQKLINSRARFKIFEQRSNRHAGSPKNPRAAYFIFGSFDLQAIGPIQHDSHDSFRFRIRARSLHNLA